MIDIDWVLSGCREYVSLMIEKEDGGMYSKYLRDWGEIGIVYI